MNAKVLVIDDEPDIRELIEITLMRMGLQTQSASSYHDALKKLQQESFDLCLTDMRLPDGDGLDILRYTQKHLPNLPCAAITAHGSMEMAIEAMKIGAFDFVSKPISLDILRNLVHQALEAPQTATVQPDQSTQLIGSSAVMQALKQQLLKFSRSQAPVYIHGESGVGKEVAARFLHENSTRQNGPFVAVNCGAIPSELMESEFFGHLKGSFTGATDNREGLFQSAAGGTLFLDEVADLPLHMQVKLLRVLQEKKVRPVGSNQEYTIDVRIISASHKDLAPLLDSGNFRQDLYFRVHVIEAQIPPLRERRGDIPELCEFLLQRIAQHSQEKHTITANALDALQAYDFPGNIRELENILERAAALSDGEIEAEELGLNRAHTTQELETLNLLEIQTRQEHQQIHAALQRNQWNQSASARDLGMTLRQLRYRMEKMGLK